MDWFLVWAGNFQGSLVVEELLLLVSRIVS